MAYDAPITSPSPRKCSIVWCDRPFIAKGFCKVHWERDRKGIDMNMSVRFWRVPLADRLWANVNIRSSDECWPWTGKCHVRDYGTISGETGERLLAHRVAWIVTNGPIQDGLNVLHSCDNPPCCNPAHLFLGTQKENVDDMWAKNRARPPCGEKHAHKLTDAQVIEIFQRRVAKESCALIAKEFGVVPAMVYFIGNGSAWSHVTGLPKRPR